MKKLLSLLLLPTLLLGCGKEPDAPTEKSAVSTAQSASGQTAGQLANTFTNPIFPNSADPWLEYFDGNYYLTTTTWTSQLVMRKSPTLGGLATATPINVWSESDLGRCCNFWAFEFHRLNTPNGYRWYLMYTSGVAENLDRQHLSVIESQGDDPLGPYTYKGSPMPDLWNIDGNYLEHNGQLYLLWSQWVGDEQTIWISKMSNPWTVEGERVLIVRPQYEWEFSGRKVNEGPEILKRNGKTFMVYSASYCNTPDYKLGLIELVGDDPLKVDSWHKFDKPVFSKGNGVYGPGHNGFFKSPDGTEDWLIYHGNASELEGCSSTRSVRAQKFTWNDDGTPNFGEPVAAGTPVASPSGENGPLITTVQGTPVSLVSKADNSCVVSDNNGSISVAACEDTNAGENTAVTWSLDYTTNGNYRLVNSSGLFLTAGAAQCDLDKTGELAALPWHNQLCQQWQVKPHLLGWVTLVNAQTQEELRFANCQEPKPKEVAKSVDDIPQFVTEKAACVQWRLQPEHELAITSIQSGRAISIAANSIVPGSNIEQREWQNSVGQRWNITAANEGYFYIQSSANTQLCMAVAGKSIVPGSNVELAQCGEDYTQWQVEFLADGTVKLANRKSALVLDLAHGAIADHANFAQAQWLNSDGQRFQLKSIH
ncbi:alpha-L-arabinofuranosidase [Cellvibrio mixtus]|uniref:Alpha-L-arabinofuranosidase n=1 Tax=Cellvibrio mixtus TaxID=39650 RepID=A0A266Q9E7_9GAMM|nr:family 43 glycosylhydrolase [Cellvibrio mixtus]OZY86523.1 alpha-L-arabinofuranosidase [Cellvibrio mixtus]